MPRGMYDMSFDWHGVAQAHNKTRADAETAKAEADGAAARAVEEEKKEKKRVAWRAKSARDQADKKARQLERHLEDLAARAPADAAHLAALDALAADRIANGGGDSDPSVLMGDAVSTADAATAVPAIFNASVPADTSPGVPVGSIGEDIDNATAMAAPAAFTVPVADMGGVGKAVSRASANIAAAPAIIKEPVPVFDPNVYEAATVFEGAVDGPFFNSADSASINGPFFDPLDALPVAGFNDCRIPFPATEPTGPGDNNAPAPGEEDAPLEEEEDLMEQ